jgi:hypothetical protein
MKYSQWGVRPIMKETPTGSRWVYELYRMETGGEFKDQEDAEHVAYELNREATDGADK